MSCEHGVKLIEIISVWNVSSNRKTSYDLDTLSKWFDINKRLNAERGRHLQILRVQIHARQSSVNNQLWPVPFKWPHFIYLRFTSGHTQVVSSLPPIRVFFASQTNRILLEIRIIKYTISIKPNENEAFSQQSTSITTLSVPYTYRLVLVLDSIACTAYSIRFSLMNSIKMKIHQVFQSGILNGIWSARYKYPSQ